MTAKQAADRGNGREPTRFLEEWDLLSRTLGLSRTLAEEAGMYRSGNRRKYRKPCIASLLPIVLQA
jgi:hypothetical protein